MIQSPWNTVWRFLKKLGIKPPYDPAIQLLGLYPEETKIEKDTCIPLFTAALFTMEYYSEIKRNAFESVLMRWLNLEPIIQSEVSQKEKDKYRIRGSLLPLEMDACLPGCVWNATPRSLSPLERNTGFWTQA